MDKVRAKFRVMKRAEDWNTGGVILDLLPVMVRSGHWKHDEEASAENALFWDATPSGSMRLILTEGEAMAYPVGSTVYVDVSPLEGGAWRLESITRRESQVDVRISRGWNQALELSILDGFPAGDAILEWSRQHAWRQWCVEITPTGEPIPVREG